MILFAKNDKKKVVTEDETDIGIAKQGEAMGTIIEDAEKQEEIKQKEINKEEIKQEEVNKEEVNKEKPLDEKISNLITAEFSKEHIAKFHKGGLRSGMTMEYDGTLVIIGDINPGAQIKATGNIIVLGALKGIAHAGAKGEKSAYVFALNMNPVQLRIGDIITRFPDGERSKSLKNPEYAYAEDGVIYVSAFE
ncbi:MAG: septum site-determining protein MinC [Anaerotignaceae bacterium]